MDNIVVKNSADAAPSEAQIFVADKKPTDKKDNDDLNLTEVISSIKVKISELKKKKTDYSEKINTLQKECLKNTKQAQNSQVRIIRGIIEAKKVQITVLCESIKQINAQIILLEEKLNQTSIKQREQVNAAQCCDTVHNIQKLFEGNSLLSLKHPYEDVKININKTPDLNNEVQNPILLKYEKMKIHVKDISEYSNIDYNKLLVKKTITEKGNQKMEKITNETKSYTEKKSDAFEDKPAEYITNPYSLQSGYNAKLQNNAILNLNINMAEFENIKNALINNPIKNPNGCRNFPDDNGGQRDRILLNT